MYFDSEKDLNIFDEFFKKRPEVSVESLKEDLTKYYLPYAQKLIELKKNKPNSNGIIVGVSAIQGAGKTTHGEVLEILLKHLGHSSVSRSIDDHYITHKELCELRTRDPRFIRRGVTHDISLAILDLRDLREMEEGKPILVSGYDKGAQHGDGDRFMWINPEEGLEIKVKLVEEELMVNKELQKVKALQLVSSSWNGQEVYLPRNMGSDVHVTEPILLEWLQNEIHSNEEISISMEGDQVKFATANSNIMVPKKSLPNGWRLITKKPDFIFYDGWMLGARRMEDESVFDVNLPALETEADRNFAKDVNKKLENYHPLWTMFEFMSVLYVPNYQKSIEWRDSAEETLRVKGEGMTHDEIKDFVHYFWRSVHPAIHIKQLAQNPTNTQQVVIIGDQHEVIEVITPEEVKLKYP